MRALVAAFALLVGASSLTFIERPCRAPIRMRPAAALSFDDVALPAFLQAHNLRATGCSL
jgi:peptidoglycan/LPS O-acetylase OafA/YrhL